MAYTKAAREQAVEMVRRNNGVLDSATLTVIKAAIGQGVTAPAIRGWLKNSSGQQKKLPPPVVEPIDPGQQKTTRHRAPAKVWDKAFLAELRLSGVVSAACLIAQVDRSTVYDRRNSDPVFAAAFAEAIEESADWLEKEARRRAEEGTLKNVYYKGQLVGFEQEYSDTLMALLLKGNRPDKFGDKLTIHLDLRQAAILARYNLTGIAAMEILINELDEVDANASTD